MMRALKIALMISVWVFIFAKAYILQITNDESYSYLLVKTNYLRAMPGSANTHWLNSIGIKFGLFFGDAPWKLRIFSILAWALYAWAAYQISNLFFNKWVGLAFFSAMILNQYVIDFFTVARGYGIMLAFVNCGLFHVINLVQTNNWNLEKWEWPFVFFSLALWANFSSLYFYLSIMTLFFCFWLKHSRIRELLQIRLKAWVLFCTGSICFAILNLLFIKFYSGDLEFGKSSGMISSIIGSVVHGSFYGNINNWVAIVLSYVLLILILVGAVKAIFEIIRRINASPAAFLALVFIAFMGLNGLFHILFNTPFLFERTALIIYPMLMLVIFFMMDEWLHGRKIWFSIANSLSALITAAFMFLFLLLADLRFVNDWKFNAEVRDVLEYFNAKNAARVYMDPAYTGVFVNYYSHAYSISYDILGLGELRERENLPEVVRKLKMVEFAACYPAVDTAYFRKSGVSFVVEKILPINGAMLLKINKP